MSAMRTGTWTRRQFGQALAAMAAGLAVPRLSLGSPLPSGLNGLAFASVALGDGTGSIHISRVTNGELALLNVLPDVVPGRLLLHPTLPVLYVLHDVALWEHLPRGAVSAYRFDRRSGTLTRLNTQPLSLAATHPRDAVVFSNETALFVTTGANIYNVLPLANDGRLQPVSAIRKQIGDVGCVLRLHEDGEIVVAASGNAVHGFRLMQGDCAEIHPISLNGVPLLPIGSPEERAARVMLDVKVSEAGSRIRDMAFHAV